MPVPLPRMCSVLAHELRSPLSVLQGYIRLLQRQRDAGHPETAMLDAMLDATGRLTAIARQASELGAWLAARDTTPLESVAVADVLEEITKRTAPDGAISVIRTSDSGEQSPRVQADASALAGAVMALAESMAREAGGSVVEISHRRQAPDASPSLSLRTRTAPAAENGHVEGHAQRALSFDRGGAGLALIAASYILDAHGAHTRIGNVPGSIDIHFGKDGGAM
jgi:K+-sensing histidine kinase KdpD